MRIIAGEFRGRRLTPLKGRKVRPTTDRVREAWMSAMGGHFPGWRVLDLFAGSGALGLECLSRGADHVTFVEIARGSVNVLQKNIELVGAEDRCDVIQADVFSWLSRLSAEESSSYDVALADPPYGEGLAPRLAALFHESPFANTLWLEHASTEAIPSVPGLTQRRYGDTTLSIIDAPS